MNDDIVEGLTRAVDDGGRPLGFDAADVVRVGRSRRRRRRVFGGSATALGIAVVAIVGWGALPSQDRSAPADGVPYTVPLELRPLTQAELDAMDWGDCGLSSAQVEHYTVLHGYQVDFLGGPKPVLLAERIVGPNFRECDVDDDQGSLGVGPSSRPRPDARQPLLDKSESYSEFYPTPWKGEDWWISGYFMADDTVARLETRVGTPDGSEPWRVSRPHHGLVYWAAWFDAGTYDAGDEVWLKWRAYDTAGNLIDPGLMPEEPRRIDLTPPK